ncbi:hypothetical protein IWZ03DRAFT_1151 [Phyllosticta citriasiana]|uniref:Heterokaryon incompatibility domain-containing protein n=1 Tax=Phyllosticta citriasiana TaxID=595635 RepID=A0ABR1KWR4_9PEZI
MGHIFSQASEVLAWIGDEEDGSCDALYTLAVLGGHFESRNSASTIHTTRWSAQQKALRRANLDQTRKLFMRAWWHRVWVIQEVTLARSAYIMCGTRLFHWTNIVTGLGYFELKHQTFSKFGWDSEFREIYGPVEHFLIFRESFQRAQLDAREDSQEHAEYVSKNKTKGTLQDSAAFENFSGTGLTLEETLECLMRLDDENLEASNDKDRVYAFLAFLLRRSRALIPVDYSKSTKVSQILDEITWVMFRRRGPRILTCSRSATARTKGLSSWHIDWTRINLDFAMYDPTGDPRSGAGAEWFLRAFETDDDRSRLPTEGIILSTAGMFASFDMETLSSVKALSQSHDSSRVKALKTWMQKMKTLVEKSPVNESFSTSRRSSVDDLWLVAIAGYQHNRLLAGSSLLSKYDPIQAKPSRSEPLMKLRYHCDLCDIDADDASALSEREVQKLRRDWESRHFQRLYENFQIMMDEVEPNEEADFHTAVMSYWRRLRINGNKGFVTPNGRAGLGPETMRTDDLIVIFKGCEFPFVIRPSCKERKEYELVGACYVDGIMDGEAIKDNPEFEEMFLV